MYPNIRSGKYVVKRNFLFFHKMFVFIDLRKYHALLIRIQMGNKYGLGRLREKVRGARVHGEY
jgi:hypothetical protein